MNAERIQVTSFLSGLSIKNERLAKPWANVLGVLLICASAQVVAQVCESERQQMIAAGANVTIGEAITYLNQNVRDRYDYQENCIASARAVCEAYATGAKPIPTSASPEYGDLLRLQAEIQLFKASIEQNQPTNYTQRRLFACVARHMADQINAKKKRAYQ